MWCRACASYCSIHTHYCGAPIPPSFRHPFCLPFSSRRSVGRPLPSLTEQETPSRMHAPLSLRRNALPPSLTYFASLPTERNGGGRGPRSHLGKRVKKEKKREWPPTVPTRTSGKGNESLFGNPKPPFVFFTCFRSIELSPCPYLHIGNTAIQL